MSFDNEVIRLHPDSAFNPRNTPQLIPAIEVDLVIQRINEDLENEQFAITSDFHVNEVVSRIHHCLWNVLHLEEYWLIDPQRILMTLSEKYQLLSCFLPECETLTDEQLLCAFSQCLFEDQIGSRFPVSIDTGSFSVCLSLNVERFSHYVQTGILNSKQIQRVIESLNSRLLEVVESIVQSICSALRNTIHYRFIEKDHSTLYPTRYYPLVEQYFTDVCDPTREHRRSYSSESTTLFCANNGWTFDNCKDTMNIGWNGMRRYIFQSSDSILPFIIQTKYLTREIVIWSDCIKLRYFENRTKPTWVYGLALEYIQISSYLFDGFRLDNCHNTSLLLLESLLEEARKINPKLLLLAELFTQDQATDIEYISKLGIDMIVRESAQHPDYYSDVRRYSDILYNVGGEDLGSLQSIKEFPRHVVYNALPTVLYDMTHDNKSLIELYGVASIPSITVMVGMTVTNIASTKGVDDAYPFNPFVTEYRQYQTYNESLLSMHDHTIRYHFNRLISLEEKPEEVVHFSPNGYLRLLMSHLHVLLSRYSFSQRYIHHYHDTNFISIERRHAESFYSVLSITSTSFNSYSHGNGKGKGNGAGLHDLEVIGKVIGVFLSVRCNEQNFHLNLKEAQQAMKQCPFLSGIPLHFDVDCYNLQNMCTITYNETTKVSNIHLNDCFSPGSSLVLLLYNGNNCYINHFLNYRECIS